ncbi:MAG: S8 family serine peptidase, partial [bacterium]
GVTPLWIVNAVYCEATPAVIRSVADRSDVWFVQWDKVPTPDALGVAPYATGTGAPGDVLDGSFSVQWNVRKVKADSVWYVHGYTGEGVVVGNIDTGCDYTHPDLADHMWTDANYPNHGWNFEQNNNNPMDAQGHGTHTCGTVAGDGTGGDTTGMAPSAQIMTCRTKTSISQPYPDTIAENTVLNSMQFCVAPPLSPANHAHLLTMSLGWIIRSWHPREAVWRAAVTNVAAAGLPYFIAAGNEGSSSPPMNLRCPGHAPDPWKHPSDTTGGLSGSISIGATDNADNIASFSSWGPVTWDTIAPYNDYHYPPGLLKPSFSAPGVNVTSTRLGGGYTQMSGTSMATPCAAGVAALMLEKNPGLLPEEVDEIMQNSVQPLGAQPKNNTYGTGRIDAMLCIENTPLPGPRHDVVVGPVLAPADKIDPLVPLAPVVVVKNRGTYPEPSVTVYCKVESLGTQVYQQNVTISLDSAGTDTATFANWNVGPGSQTYDLTFWHTLAGDTNRRNDTITASTTTRGHDVRAAGMNIGGRVRANNTLTPRITLASTDYTERGFKAYCRIDSAGTTLYRDSVDVDSVPEMGSRSFLFPEDWDIGPVGASYDVTMWHNCGPDQNRTNDTLHATAVAVDQIRVLWLYSDYSEPESTLGVRLRALGDSIEYMSVQTTTPTLDQLTPYDAVGAHSNYGYANATNLGNVLADYVDAGGGVVMGTFSFSTGWAMAGRIMTGNYATIVPGSNPYNSVTLAWHEPSHPILAGVDSVREYYAGNGAFAAGAESVAKWSDGRRYVAVSANQKVAAVNSYPGVYTASPPQRGGDWALVFHNALAFVSGGQTGVEDLDPLAPVLHVELSAAPNPAQLRVNLSYAVPLGGPVELGIYDLSGRLVRTLVRGEVGPGVNRTTWDRRDDGGREVAAGVYFCKLTAGAKTESRKLVLR